MDKGTFIVKHHGQEFLIIGILLWDRYKRRGHHGDGKILENIHNHQINPTSSVLLPFEGRSLIRFVLHITNIIQNESYCRTWAFLSWSTQLVRKGKYLLKKCHHIHPFLGEGLFLYIICINGQKGSREEKLLNMQSPLPEKSMRACDVIYYSLASESYAVETSCL